MVHRFVCVRLHLIFMAVAFYPITGSSVEIDMAIPAPGTSIANFANDSINLEFFCRLRDNQTQLITNWFFLSAASRAAGRTAGSVRPGDPRFTQSGDIIFASGINISNNANLTVNGLTTDLHNSIVSCGLDEPVAEFTILVYEHPSIPNNLTLTVVDLYANISWQPPSNLGSPEVSYYSLVISDDRGTVVYNETLPANESTEFIATGLLPLTNYTVELRAVSQISPVLIISPITVLPFATNTSVPLVNCTATSISADQTNVRIAWDNIHTGGLELTSATVEYALLSSTNFTPVINETVNVVDGEAIVKALPTAGMNYVFRVTTENSEGESVPSNCPTIFLTVGTPSVPDTPIAEADGPEALLTLRTANAGTGDSRFAIKFTVFVFRFNSTELVAEVVLFNSTEYTSNQSVVVRVEDVMELNQLYQFAARAENMFGVSAVSALSAPILLNISEPSIDVVKLQKGKDGITVTWDFLHTGGLNITQVEILLREDRDDSSFIMVPGGNITRPMNDSFLVSGRYLQAGLTYQMAVRATNELGVSELIVSETQRATVGVPAVPLVPTLFSSTTTSITLNLYTATTGLIGEGEEVTFRVRITETSADEISETFQEDNFPANISGMTIWFPVSDPQHGSSYIFSVRTQNRFGFSNFSGDSERISLEVEGGGEDEPRNDGLEMRELIGIIVGVAIVVVMLVLCCILLLCALLTRGGKPSKTRETGIELTDNSLYDKSRTDRHQGEFPPEAFESQYEPPPDDNPKPTHPTGQLDQPQPLYDTLNPSQRQHSTNSIGSGRELPNPLYSGVPSSRPTSQLQDSGSGTVRSARGTEGEPLYSEANDTHTSRTSHLIEAYPPPPPPPDPESIPSDPFSPSPPPVPHPRNIPTVSPITKDPLTLPGSDPMYDPLIPTDIPTYAEAGPGSQEHLYSELPDPSQSDKDGSTHHPPVFHVPPPPLPPTSSEKPGEFLPPGTITPSLSRDTL